MKNYTILIAEDDGITAFTLKQKLERIGHTVLSIVATGEKAIKETERLSPDLVFMDIKLEDEICGIEAAREIRKRLRIPVVFITAHSEGKLLENAIEADSSGFLFKPVDEKDLFVTIKTAMARAEMERKSRVNAVLSEISREIIACRSLNDISYHILEEGKKLTGSRFGFVGYLDQKTGNFIATTLTRDVWDICKMQDKTHEFKEFKDLWGWVLENKKSILPNNLTTDPRSTGVPRGHIPIDKFLLAPAMTGDQMMGQIALANSNRDYTDKDLDVVENLAGLYALAVQQFQFEEMIIREKERAEYADRAKSIFLANMSHEIRTPLNLIMGFLELVLSEESISAENRDYLKTAHESGKLLLTLINDILDLSKIESGKFKMEETPCSLKEEIFAPVESNLKVLLKGKNNDVKVIQKYPSDIEEYILCDPFRLTQVLNNLLSNSAKFIEKGFIEYGARLKNRNTLQFWVKDTGVGIPEEKQKEVFEPFTQAEAGITRRYGGTGLGLAIAKRLVEIMGGERNNCMFYNPLLSCKKVT